MKKIIIAAAFIAASGIGAGVVYHAEPMVEYRYEVEDGDTVWNIASRVNRDHEDVRAVVYRIKEDNGLGNRPIQPGEILKIKVKKI